MPDLAPYMNIIIIAGALLVAALALLILIKIFGGSVKGRKGSRLGISEYYEIDKTRRLVLLRRDDTEHLVLIGGAQDVVIEQGIGSPLMAEEVAPSPAMRQAPRPAVFGARRPPLRTVDGTIEMPPPRNPQL
jgi:Flagellar biosynthesis protein, FliO